MKQLQKVSDLRTSKSSIYAGDLTSQVLSKRSIQRRTRAFSNVRRAIEGEQSTLGTLGFYNPREIAASVDALARAEDV